MKMTTYKALQDCRVDTFRKKGEVFEAEAFEDCPPFLEEVDPEEVQPEPEPEPENGSGGEKPEGGTLPPAPPEPPAQPGADKKNKKKGN